MIVAVGPKGLKYQRLSPYLNLLEKVGSLIYFDCNLQSVLKDWNYLKEIGFVVKQIQPIEMIRENPQLRFTWITYLTK